jgi:hypothetical protein
LVVLIDDAYNRRPPSARKAEAEIAKQAAAEADAQRLATLRANTPVHRPGYIFKATYDFGDGVPTPVAWRVEDDGSLQVGFFPRQLFWVDDDLANVPNLNRPDLGPTQAQLDAFLAEQWNPPPRQAAYNPVQDAKDAERAERRKGLRQIGVDDHGEPIFVPIGRVDQ